MLLIMPPNWVLLWTLEAGKVIHIQGVEESISLEQRFFILGLAPNAARIAVRFFYQASFGNILRHIKAVSYTHLDVYKRQVMCKFNEALGCMGDIERFADYSAARLQDCDGALAF